MTSYEGVNFQSLDTFLIALLGLTYKDNITQNKENKIIIIMVISPETFFFLERISIYDVYSLIIALFH